MSVTRVGQVRPSQLLRTYGPGAVVDLPHLSVLVMGLDAWTDDATVAAEVTEDRLLAAVRRLLGARVTSLRLPPHRPETPNVFDDWARTGVPVRVFPTWLRCPLCDQIAQAQSGLFDLRGSPYRPDLARYRHTNCNKAKGKTPPAVPVRYLLACREGHLDDFPWTDFVHHGAPCATPLLRLYEQDQSLRLDQVLVTCTNCKAKRSMVDAFGEQAERNLPRCDGRHPHLRWRDSSCPQRGRTLLLGASNSWFSVTLRVLSVPRSAAPLAQLVDEHWPLLVGVESSAELAVLLKHARDYRELAGHDADAVWAAMQARRAGADNHEPEDLLGPEWEHLSGARGAAAASDFTLRQVPVPRSFTHLVDRTVLAERLREVVALVGFTRLDPPGEPDLAGQIAARAPLARTDLSWVPCVVTRGEGVFLQLDEETVAKWEAAVSARPRLVVLEEAHRRWRLRRALDPAYGWPGARYVALHTISHLLMREMALECGYSAASISERLYARVEPTPMAGILLYTAASDSEGTLGGLVSLGDPETLDRLLRQALRRATRCTTDPLCSEHLPGPEEEALHGAACHACLFAPETSCERANRYLDRSLVVDTFAAQGLGLCAR